MLEGLNHITIAVQDIDHSFEFYIIALNMTPVVKWQSGAYLTLDGVWYCLSSDTPNPSQDYCHISFTVQQDNFEQTKSKLLEIGVEVWKENESEGDSLYFLDPNGHKLEIHTGTLLSRLEALREKPYDDLEWF